MKRSERGFLKAGAKGTPVLEIQKKLKEKGFDPGNIDGDFGNATERAVKSFQEKAELEPDGVVGPETLNALGLSPELLQEKGQGEAEVEEEPEKPSGPESSVQEERRTRKDLPVYPQQCRYDGEMDRVGRIAAWIGEHHGDETPVTFGSLWAAFFVAEDSVSKWIQGYDKSAGAGLAQRVLAHNRIGNDNEKEFILKSLESGKVPVTHATDGAYYSSSVRTLLEKACEKYGIRDGEKVLGTRDVMAAYVFDGEDIHSDAFKKFDMDGRDLMARFVLPDPQDIAPLTTQTSREILLRAKELRRFRNTKEQDLTSGVLLYAALERGKEGDLYGEPSPPCRALLNAVNSLAPSGMETLFSGYFQGTPENRVPKSGGIATMSANSARLLYAAQEYSLEYFSFGSGIHENGLVAALLSGGSAAVGRYLQNSGMDEQGLRKAFLSQIDIEGSDRALVWSRLFAGEPPPERADWISGFTADNPFDKKVKDALDVENEAGAFARIAAARKVTPPLASGVFGEWGSGKTFFMNRMSTNVASLASEARKSINADLFHGEIVQIRFNAWHYMETNLWASLVEYIFQELDRWLRSKEQDFKEIDKLFEQLSTTQQLKLESVRAVIQARKEEKRASQRVTAALNEMNLAQEKRASLTPENIRAAAVEAFQQSLTEKEREEIWKAVESLGFTALGKSAVEARTLVEQVQAQKDRGQILWRSLVSMAGKSRTFWVLAFLLVAVPGSMLLLTKWLPDGWVDWIRTMTGSLSYYVVVFTGVAVKVIHRTSQGLGTLQKFHDRLADEIRKKKEHPEISIEEAERELEKRRTDLESAEQHLREANRRLEEAHREWVDATARGRLNRFIRDKVVGGHYAKHLGIIAAIRKDFGELAQLMAEQEAPDDLVQAEEQSTKDNESEVERLIEEAGSNLTEEEKNELRQSARKRKIELKAFQRIILYIDDLDRCPCDKVVEVLQAIHLLLCFPLFVVVVAVDARWVSRALNRVFPELLEENVIVATNHASAVALNGGGDKLEGRRGATSQDYLEKIFQIPYWVRPMEATAAKKYVEGLVAEDLRKQPVKDLGGDPGGAGPGEQAEVPDSSGQKRGEDVTAPGGLETTGRETEGRVEETIKTESLQPSKSREASKPPKMSRQQVVKSMYLTNHEEGLLKTLAPFIGRSPRRGLRFVNSYRLVKTSLKLNHLDALVGEDGKSLGYRALIAQLAISIGAPRIARYYFEKVGAQAKGFKTLVELAEELAKDSRITNSRDEWRNLKGLLEALKSKNEEDGIDTGKEMLKALREHAATARRYSFTARPQWSLEL